MRTKKKRPSSSTLSLNAEGQNQDNGTTVSDRDRERPMSWEGELSDSEMLVDTNTSSTPDTLLSISKTPHSDLEFRLGPQKEVILTFHIYNRYLHTYISMLFHSLILFT